MTEARKLAQQIVDYFNLSTVTWETVHPRFTRKITLASGKQVLIVVETKNKIYKVINAGTGEHPIYPRRSKDGLLHFQKFYKSKTKPGSGILSQAGGKYGPWVKRIMIPRHPGIRARRFDKDVLHLIINPPNRGHGIQDRLEVAIKKWLSASKLL